MEMFKCFLFMSLDVEEIFSEANIGKKLGVAH